VHPTRSAERRPALRTDRPPAQGRRRDRRARRRRCAALGAAARGAAPDQPGHRGAGVPRAGGGGLRRAPAGRRQPRTEPPLRAAGAGAGRSGAAAGPPAARRGGPAGPLATRPQRRAPPRTGGERLVTTAIEARGLHYRASPEFAIEDLSRSVPAGALYGFLGPNGCGKTTTIRLLPGLPRADAGTIRLLEQPVPGGLPVALARTGVMPDRPHLHRYLTVAET